ncbi:MAG: hypothetical protein U0794_20215 [Isosphaeraceae bacterium]
MSGPERELTTGEQAEAVALSLGRTVMGRDLSESEAEALASIFKAAIQALQHGFITRLAQHVADERTDEAVEEFFEEQIHPD